MLEVPSTQVLRRRIIDVFGNGYLTFMAIIQGAAFALVFFSAQAQLSGHLGDSRAAATVIQTVAAVLAIIIVSHEYLLLTVVLVWTPTVFDVAIPFLIGSGECWLASSIGHYKSWWIALSALCATAVFALWHTLARTTAEVFGDRERLYRRYCATIKKQIANCAILATLGAGMEFLDYKNAYLSTLNLVLLCLVNVAGVGIICLREHDQNRIYDEYEIPRCRYTSLPGHRP